MEIEFKTQEPKVRVLIAGGGTGGHLFPGIALAEELKQRNQEHDILFVGTRHGIETREVPRAGFALSLIEVGGLKGKGALGALRGFFRIPRAMWQSFRILKKFKPQVVVGVGGYASGPLLLTAALLGYPTVILEQNALPGFTNRVLGRFVDRVLIAFVEAERFFKAHKVERLGNPVRRQLVEQGLQKKKRLRSSGPQLLVFGGSQGARVLNQVAPVAMAGLAQKFKDLQVVHQTGKHDLAEVESRYREYSLQATVVEFIQDMAAAYQAADLVISRAGATTVAELALLGKASVLIPFPYAADNHQEINAKALVDAKAARMIRQSELDPSRLISEVSAILENEETKRQMEEAALLVGRPQAAGRICDVFMQLAQSRKPGRKDIA